MKYLSLFSGIEAASVAWSDFGWTCVGVSEIDPFACEVLKTRFPSVPNLGDITKITTEQLDDIKKEHKEINIIVGGSPCQSFSVAGHRKGLQDPRGNLMFEYVRVVETVRPNWFVWENVPGALSSGKGRDFGTLLQAMAELGYFLSWRVLDAQHFGVPQRRRRVFLVGSLDQRKSPFKVLFKSASSSWDFEPSQEEGEDDPSKAETGARKHSENGQTVTVLESNQKNATMGDMKVSPTLNAAMGQGGGHVPMIVDGKSVEHDLDCEVSTPLFARDYKGTSPDDFSPTAQKLVVEKSEPCIPIDLRNATRDPDKEKRTGLGVGEEGAPANTLTQGAVPAVFYNTRVRKLTPIECERLQGFPDNWTRIAYRKKKEESCPNSPRYKCLGNSMAVPVMRWIGARIKAMEEYQENRTKKEHFED